MGSLTTICNLPEELLEQIIALLDVPPPSQAQNTQEPSPAQLFLPNSPLKQLSLVSKQWRRLVEPVLFKCIRLCLDDEMETCEAFSRRHEYWRKDGFPLRNWYSIHQHKSFMARFASLRGDYINLTLANGLKHVIMLQDLVSDDQQYLETFFPLLKAHANDYFEGIEEKHDVDSRAPDTFRHYAIRNRSMLRQTVDSVVLHPAINMLRKTVSEQVHHDRQLGRQFYRYKDMLWRFIDRILYPRRITIVCSPSELSLLTECAIDLSDSWSFDMPYQRIQLCHSSMSYAVKLEQEQLEAKNGKGDRLRTELMLIRHWDSFEYDEGSSLVAYGWVPG